MTTVLLAIAFGFLFALLIMHQIKKSPAWVADVVVIAMFAALLAKMLFDYFS